MLEYYQNGFHSRKAKIYGKKKRFYFDGLQGTQYVCTSANLKNRYRKR